MTSIEIRPREASIVPGPSGEAVDVQLLFLEVADVVPPVLQRDL